MTWWMPCRRCKMPEPTIYELSSDGRTGVLFPEPDVPMAEFPRDLLREDLPFPELAEVDVIRHFTKLSTFNYSIDKGLYPLGSGTMKDNPKISGFDAVTLQPAAGAQGEFTGVSIIRAYHHSRNDTKRTRIIIPDSAHGTNPATS